MHSKKAKSVRRRTWYGLHATITIGPGFIHRAGWKHFLIPHPPIVNWLLRRGLPPDEYDTLSLTHEFAHFQIAPLALPYTVGLIALAVGQDLAWLSMIIVIISTHAVWEILAEMLTILHDRKFYRRCYQRISIVPRRIFWISMSMLSFLGIGILVF